MKLHDRPIAVVTISIAIVVAGIWSFSKTPLEWIPELELPAVRVSASWPGASPRAVERYVAAPVERAAQAVTGTAKVESYTEEGSTSITLSVDRSVPLAHYVSQINEQLALLRPSLPDRVVPRLTRQVPEALRDERGFMAVQLVSPLPPDELRRIAEREIVPGLISRAGVDHIDVLGGTTKEVLVTLDPSRLKVLGVTPQMINSQIQQQLVSDSFGKWRSRGQAAIVYREASESVDSLQNIPLKFGPTLVRLKDVASVAYGPAPLRSISRIDGEAVITLDIDRSRGSHLLKTANEVRTYLDQLSVTYDDRIRFLVASDRSDEVREQLADLRWRGGIGIMMVIVILLIMLKDVRAVMVTLFSVIISLSIAIILFRPLGLTLNVLTLAGLVLIFGLIVDNTVVVLEQLVRRRDAEPYDRSVQIALRAVWTPLMGGTLSTIVVMIPLLYLSGELRTLFLPFGILTALTLASSLVAAVTVVPAISKSLTVHEPTRHTRLGHRLLKGPFQLAARFPRVTLLAIILAIGIPTWTIPRSLSAPEDGWSTYEERAANVFDKTIGSNAYRTAREYLDPALGGFTRLFFRDVRFGKAWNYESRPSIYVSLRFPPGNPIQRSDELLARFEAIAIESPVPDRIIASIHERSASLQVLFTAEDLRTAAPYLLREKLISEAIQLSGINVGVSGLVPEGYYSGSGGGISGFVVEAHGPSYDDLESLSASFAAFLKAGSRRVAEVDYNGGRYSSEEPRQVLSFRWDDNATARTGLSATEINSILQPTLNRRFPSYFARMEGEPSVPIRIVTMGSDDEDVYGLSTEPRSLPDASTFQLAGVAGYSIDVTPASISREDQQYKRYIRIDYRGPYRLGDEYLQRKLEQFRVPTGYRLERYTFSFLTEETSRALGWMLFGTFALVFLISASVFESWRLGLFVMVAVPTALVGVSLAFLWTDTSFAEGAFIGSILLVGIAVNDSLLLIDSYRKFRDAGPHRRHPQLVRLAVRHRLRPMWTTTMTSIAAMAPLLIFPNASDFWLGLAVTVVGGLLAATILAPIATVSLVKLFDGGSRV